MTVWNRTILVIACALSGLASAARAVSAEESRAPAAKSRKAKRRHRAKKIIHQKFGARAEPRRGLASTEDQPKKPPTKVDSEDESTYEPDAYRGRSAE